MGRTVPTFRQLIDRTAYRFRPFRATLDKPDREYFDHLFRMVRYYSVQATYQAHDNPETIESETEVVPCSLPAQGDRPDAQQADAGADIRRSAPTAPSAPSHPDLPAVAKLARSRNAVGQYPRRWGIAPKRPGETPTISPAWDEWASS